VAQIEKHIRLNGLSDTLRDFISKAVKWTEFNKNLEYHEEVQRARMKLQALIHTSDTDSSIVSPYRLPEDDVLGKYVNEYLDRLEGETKRQIYDVLQVALTASGMKPTGKFLSASKAAISCIDVAQYKACVKNWLKFLIDAQPIEQRDGVIHLDGTDYIYVSYKFLSDTNTSIVKGLIWSLIHIQDEATTDIVAKLAERAYRKIPGTGPTCAAIGNACIYYLANCEGITGISHLSRLKLKIPQNSIRERIEKYIQEESLNRGLLSVELEEQSVPDFGLKAGIMEEQFGEYKLRIAMKRVGRTELQWLTPGGKPQKSTPAFVKNDAGLNDKLDKLKTVARQVQQYSSTQRDRIDRLYRENREWEYPEFEKYYLNHGLVSFIARRLIWSINNDGTSVSAMWLNNRWEDVEGREVSGIGDNTTVTLWHPLLVDAEEVICWRNRLDNLKIQQPVKQAYREIYIVTDAELQTGIYSNRMAAHILKQHQFNALTSVRGWKYQLLGDFDDGRAGETARISLPAYQITGEYWINEVCNVDSCNETGIWNYIATDQVRFIDSSGEVIPLSEVPGIIFSEIMRDVDLFVGVCSVGNDPQWLDRGGIPEYREYWMDYSFGDLTEIANTRKLILEKLIPGLKIRNQAIIDDTYLRIKGRIREYKIHIGSTNILMEPNNQYLCIVPGRESESIKDKVFLPFEDDRGLALIISKAFLLADDDKITDPTIVQQISRNLS
jgi:hypothetical protein